MPIRRALTAAILAGAVASAACGDTPPPRQQTTAQSAGPAPSSSSSPSDLPPLPQVPFPAARPMPMVEAAFRFAAMHPEVLSKMPCFCGCEHRGHRANDDCFVASRDEHGRVTVWEPHGIACGICIDVAREAMQGYQLGTPLTAIRAGIEAKYRPKFPTMTPTPPIGK